MKLSHKKKMQEHGERVDFDDVYRLMDNGKPLLPHPRPAPVLSTYVTYSPGGVAVSAANGRIVCDNTLSSRLQVIYQELLPKIRNLLFPAF